VYTLSVRKINVGVAAVCLSVLDEFSRHIRHAGYRWTPIIEVWRDHPRSATRLDLCGPPEAEIQLTLSRYSAFSRAHPTRVADHARKSPTGSRIDIREIYLSGLISPIFLFLSFFLSLPFFSFSFIYMRCTLGSPASAPTSISITARFVSSSSLLVFVARSKTSSLRTGGSLLDRMWKRARVSASTSYVSPLSLSLSLSFSRSLSLSLSLSVSVHK